MRAGLARVEWRDSPLTTYYLLLGATSMLVVIGLVMVLSASSITAMAAGQPWYAVFADQLLFAGIGVVGALVASRIPVTGWRRLALPSLLGSLALQLLVFTPFGHEVNGNRNWVALGPVTLQPSEFVKLGLALFGALVLSKKRAKVGRVHHAVVPLVFPAGALALGLVLRGHDLGTALVLVAILVGMLFASGVPARAFLLAGSCFAVMAGALVVTSSNRMSRIQTWLAGGCADVQGACWQTEHGKYALADGGWWGVGLGASREKWSWLPAAHNDFIFAIIGEELGLPGTLVVLGLFAVLGYACFRLVLRSDDHFVRLGTAGIMVWMLAQATINIGAVIGMLPVIGVPLPLVSSGGSALITALVALGVLLSFARHEPGCREALAARPGVVRRSLAVLPTRRAGRMPGRRARGHLP
ncbi:MAG TPA: putative lipid II flippase FtsW [Dermatophilaceae bacterium]|nr:putative lipid II flippase FtsW [Dermatophilaceae bacterium]